MDMKLSTKKMDKVIEYFQKANEALSKDCKRSCGLFHLGAVTPEKLYIFKCLIKLLYYFYGVRDFFIEQPYCNSEFVLLLKKDFKDAKITAVTHYPQQTPNEEETLDELYAEFCHERINVPVTARRPVSVAAQTVSYIMSVTDFGICDMSRDDLVVKRIKKSTNLIFDLNCEYITEK